MVCKSTVVLFCLLAGISSCKSRSVASAVKGSASSSVETTPEDRAIKLYENSLGILKSLMFDIKDLEKVKTKMIDDFFFGVFPEGGSDYLLSLTRKSCSNQDSQEFFDRDDIIFKVFCQIDPSLVDRSLENKSAVGSTQYVESSKLKGILAAETEKLEKKLALVKEQSKFPRSYLQELKAVISSLDSVKQQIVGLGDTAIVIVDNSSLYMSPMKRRGLIGGWYVQGPNHSCEVIESRTIVQESQFVTLSICRTKHAEDNKFYVSNDREVYKDVVTSDIIDELLKVIARLKFEANYVEENLQ